MKGIIPTGGRGTRMQPLTFSANKHFIPLANKPLIFYPIETVVLTGIKEIAITYNPGFLDEVKSYLDDGKRWGVKFTYVLQEKPAGLANIVSVCEEYLKGDSFVLHLGDNIFDKGIKDAIQYFESKKPNGLVTMVHHKENMRLGVPYFDKNGRLLKYVEKPENPPHGFAVPGLYFGDNKFFDCFKGSDAIKPSQRGEYEIPDAFQWMIDHKLRVDVLEYKGKWLDPGKFNDWIFANQYILDTKLEENMESEVDSKTTIENRVSVGKDCRIVNSHLRGPLILGDGVFIKDSYIGPFSSISNGCVIEGSHVENSVLMEKVKILNVKMPIDTSLIGPEAEIFDGNQPTQSIKFFIGEKSRVQL